MRSWICVLVLAVAAVLPAGAQDVDVSSLDALRERAAGAVAFDLGPELLEFARAALPGNSEAASAIAEIVDSLEAFHLRTLEFDGTDQYAPADLEALRRQLESAGWIRVIEVREGGEDVGIWIFRDGGEEFEVRSEALFDERFTESGLIGGLAVLVQEPEEIVFLHVVGPLRPQDLALLSGPLGIPLPGAGGN